MTDLLALDFTPADIEGLDQVPSPAVLLIIHERLEANLAEMIRIAGGPHRLRPHCKTHKMAAIVRRLLELGIERHKCATIAEAEMLADSGAPDIFLAYPPVGPNLARVRRLADTFPDVTWSVTADDVDCVRALDAAMAGASRAMGVFLDVDPGMHRTGLPADERAVQVYGSIAACDHLVPCGFHLYDGHNRQVDVGDRRRAVRAVWDDAMRLAETLEARGLSVPSVVAGGTGSFPCFAEIQDPRLQLSPGTIVFHDAGYARAFPDLAFRPAALLLTRVISRPGPDRVTLDIGHKACAADPPAGRRLYFPALPDAEEVMQNEEHLVLRTEGAKDLRPGDALLAIPSHVCPTSAVHQEAIVIRSGRVAETWPVTARDRRLTI